MRVLHLLSQRPLLTGSGVTLAELCRHAAAAGHEQHVVCAVPAGDEAVDLPEVPAANAHPLRFEQPIPGMSDVMPYESRRWRDLSAEDLAAYRDAWRAHLARVAEVARPDVVHAHHVWLLSTLARDAFPDARLLVHSHATGLRQMELCPHLADEVREGVARADALVALHAAQADQLAATLDVPRSRVHVVGAGYREDLFHAEGRSDGGAAIAYAGKLANAKGFPWLLDAFARVRAARPDARLLVAGGAGGEEGAALRARAAAAPVVELLGRLDQAALADVLRRSAVFVLPSMYEGLPLVLAEARACGCRLVSTALPGVVGELAPHLGEALALVDPPRLRNVDEPVTEDLPGFVEALADALAAALAAGPAPLGPDALAPFTWRAVFARVEAAWR